MIVLMKNLKYYMIRGFDMDISSILFLIGALCVDNISILCIICLIWFISLLFMISTELISARKEII